jgi:hypothetical protein
VNIAAMSPSEMCISVVTDVETYRKENVERKDWIKRILDGPKPTVEQMAHYYA